MLFRSSSLIALHHAPDKARPLGSAPLRPSSLHHIISPRQKPSNVLPVKLAKRLPKTGKKTKKIQRPVYRTRAIDVRVSGQLPA
jgi:hypothetical protein